MNKLKRVLTGTLALAMAASMFAACGDDDSSSSNSGGSASNNSGDSSGKIDVKVYTFTDETQGMIDRFLEDNPDIDEKYNFVVTLEDNSTNYITKVTSALGTSDAPDVFVADADYAILFANNAGTAALSDLGIEVNAADYYQYMLDFTAVDGVYKGISHQAAAGGVLYRTDIAEEVLGVSSPEDVQAKLSTWDDFKAVADQMKEAGVYMISGIDELKRCFMNNRSSAWIVGDMEYSIDEATVKEYLEVTKYLADNGETALVSNTQWTPDWYKGMYTKDGDGRVFCYFGCTWYLHYTIKPNSVTERTGDVDDDGNPTAADADYYVGNGTYGDWGLITGPAAYFWGGTWWFGSTNATSDGTKDAVKALIEYYCVNDDTIKAYMEDTGDFPGKKTVAEQLSTSNDFLGGQDHFAAFRDAADKIDASTCTQYDDTFNTAVNDATEAYVINDVSLDDAIASIKDYAATNIEGLKVD